MVGNRKDIGDNNNTQKQSELLHNSFTDSVTDLSSQESLVENVYRETTAAICMIRVVAEGEYIYLDFNPRCEAWLGTTTDKLRGKSPQDIFAVQNVETVVNVYNRCVRSQQTISYEDYIVSEAGSSCWMTTIKPIIDSHGKVIQLISTSVDISQRQQTEAEITIQANRVKLLSAIALRIRESLDLSTILQQTVDEVRSFLNTDRVLICRVDNLKANMAVESIAPAWDSILERNIADTCFTTELVDRYGRGRIQVIEDINKANLSKCYFDLLDSCQVKANLVVPIVAESKLWGLLLAQHCRSPRQWQQGNIELLEQLATRVGIAVQQAELHQRLQHLNISLEAEVEQRTAQLRATLEKLEQSLRSEALVRSITQAIRDSLDEKQILQTATKSLTEGLSLEYCQIELYKHHQTVTEVICEYPIVLPDEAGICRQVTDYPELYQPLLAKKSLHFVDWLPTIGYRQQRATRLVCPIFDDRGILGNLWLMRSKESLFESGEIKLVEQIADQCAIAIRQARLYQTEQIQVKELEKLSLVKDDFLKTISHELRTPMSRLRLAISTLENLLEVELGATNSVRIEKVMNIFHTSFKKQNQLIDDLLTLCYVDTASKPDLWQAIDLQTWIPQIVKTFSWSGDRVVNLDLAEELPPLYSDAKMLKRVINELLNNAYKYTPEGEVITIATFKTPTQLLIKVINTGVEIPVEEQERIFDKFYRIPNNDPWQHGGTGIGLALVKKLVELLEGEISVDSQQRTTVFTLTFALNKLQ